MFFWGSKVQKEKIDSVTKQILELQVQKKEIEISLTQQKLELENDKKVQELKLFEEKEKGRIELDSLKSAFKRSEKEWQEDKQLTLQRAKEANELLVEKIRLENEMKLMELTTLSRLETEQKLKQSELKRIEELNAAKDSYTKALLELEAEYQLTQSQDRAEYSKKVLELQTKLAEDYYNKLNIRMESMHEKLNTSLTNFHEKGDKNSQFVQSLALEIMRKAPVDNSPNRKIESITFQDGV